VVLVIVLQLVVEVDGRLHVKVGKSNSAVRANIAEALIRLRRHLLHLHVRKISKKYLNILEREIHGCEATGKEGGQVEQRKVKSDTEFEAFNRMTPTGMKMTPITRNEMMTGSGVRIGCQAFSFCCAKAVSKGAR